MKQILTILMLGFALISYGQDSKKLGKSFTMVQNYHAKRCNAVGDSSWTDAASLERTFIVIVEAMTDKGYVISVPSFTESKRKDYLNDNFDKSPERAAVTEVKDSSGKIIITAKPAKSEEEIYFFISLAEFDKVCEKITSNHSFTVGIPTIPAKIRFGNGGRGDDPRYFRFEGNVSLGLSGGWKYSFGEDNKYGINTLVGFTIASVAVDSLTTKGKVNSNTSAASFSPHIGGVFDVQSFQFGLYGGIDFLYGEPNKYWVYRNNLWLGIGIGYSLFKTDGNKKSNE